MQAFPTSGAPSQGPKNYVFVDEHNRHKRLKVMRACEGCRRRKIRCDAATTNSWPCAACKRLKLHCVPPVGGVEGDFAVGSGGEDQLDFQSHTLSMPSYEADHPQYDQSYHSISDQQAQGYDRYALPGQEAIYAPPNYPYHTVLPDQRHNSQSMVEMYPQRYASFDSAHDASDARLASSPGSPDTLTAEELAEQLGDLKINELGVAPYLRPSQTSRLEAAAPIQDVEEKLPAFSTSAGSQIRIPPALMPSDEAASAEFRVFFRHVHPYVPVVCRSHFYHQWHQDRNAISPLLLETMFACAGHMSGDPGGGSQWLALANKHEEAFSDHSRLSTLQALILLLKAREASPKRGYFYRSWMTCKKIVSMAKDLELDEHYSIHQAGQTCDSTAIECLTKTRAWQLTMTYETMIGGSQGRLDYGVDITIVDVTPNPPNADIDDYEKMISRQFAYFVRNIRNIRGISETSQKLKRKKDWGIDPMFAAYNEDFRKWPESLPGDLQLSIPDDGSKPALLSHFIANMHCHYQLGIVMSQRAQLVAFKSADSQWKHHMSASYKSAKLLCRIQEAILEQHDMIGLAAMHRGYSFHLYAILTCTMLHLIAITSPDPEFNIGSKEYFVRHMRILERCIAEWSIPETDAQINALRAAFSADLNKPFELKATFPYGAPSESSRSPEGSQRPSEPVTTYSNHPEQQFPPSSSIQQSQYYPSSSISGSVGTGVIAPQYYQDYMTDGSHAQYQHVSSTSHPQHTNALVEQWNPAPIISQFQTAFTIPASALAPPPPSHGYGSSPPIAPHTHNMPSPMGSQQYVPSPQSQSYPTSQYTPPPQPVSGPPSSQSHQQQQQPYLSSRSSQSHLSPQPPPLHQYYDSASVTPPSVPGHQQYGPQDYTTASTVHMHNPAVFVTPKEWQQSVASVYDPGGLKRRWDYQ